MRPVGSHRSCTRSRLTSVEVRLPTSREFTRRPCSSRCLHGSALFCVFGFLPDASVSHSARSVAPVQTGVPRFAGSTTALGLWRKRNPSRRFHRLPPAVCSRFAPLCRTSAAAFLRRSGAFAHGTPTARLARPPTAHSLSRSPQPPAQRSPFIPSFSLSFPCPKSFSRGCC